MLTKTLQGLPGGTATTFPSPKARVGEVHILTTSLHSGSALGHPLLSHTLWHENYDENTSARMSIFRSSEAILHPRNSPGKKDTFKELRVKSCFFLQQILALL